MASTRREQSAVFFPQSSVTLSFETRGGGAYHPPPGLPRYENRRARAPVMNISLGGKTSPQGALKSPS